MINADSVKAKLKNQALKRGPIALFAAQKEKREDEGRMKNVRVLAAVIRSENKAGDLVLNEHADAKWLKRKSYV